MFDVTSRYYNLETATWTAPDGRLIPYRRRRFLPQGDALPPLAEVTINQGDRLDVITARALGVAEQFWQICDANNAMNPDDLTAEVSRVLRIPMPQGQG